MPVTIDLSEDSHEFLERIKQCLEDGGVMAIPTDSFYGLAVDPFQDKGGQRLKSIKGGRVDSPFPVLIGNLAQLPDLVRTIPPQAESLMQKFWPGLLTIVMAAQARVASAITAGTGTVGVRQPAHATLCRLLTEIGPVTGTSANRTGVVPCRTAEEVSDRLGSEVDLILDGGATPGLAPSTVVGVAETIRIIRQGALSPEDLRRELGSEFGP